MVAGARRQRFVSDEGEREDARRESIARENERGERKNGGEKEREKVESGGSNACESCS